MVHLQAVADQASSSVVERLLAAEADDALRLVDVVRQRYDVVLMNPPFGEPVPETKPYLRAAYPWLPTKDYNLLAAFVGRGSSCANPTVTSAPSPLERECSSPPSSSGDGRSSSETGS